MQPPLGPPVWAALNFLPPGMPPPMPRRCSRGGCAHGHFDQAGVVDLAPARAKTLVPALLGVPMALEPLSAVIEDGGDVGEASPRC